MLLPSGSSLTARSAFIPPSKTTSIFDTLGLAISFKPWDNSPLVSFLHLLIYSQLNANDDHLYGDYGNLKFVLWTMRSAYVHVNLCNGLQRVARFNTNTKMEQGRIFATQALDLLYSLVENDPKVRHYLLMTNALCTQLACPLRSLAQKNQSVAFSLTKLICYYITCELQFDDDEHWHDFTTAEHVDLLLSCLSQITCRWRSDQDIQLCLLKSIMHAYHGRFGEIFAKHFGEIIKESWAFIASEQLFRNPGLLDPSDITITIETKKPSRKRGFFEDDSSESSSSEVVKKFHYHHDVRNLISAYDYYFYPTNQDEIEVAIKQETED